MATSIMFVAISNWIAPYSDFCISAGYCAQCQYIIRLRGAFRKAAMYSSSPQQYLPPQPEGPVLSPPFFMYMYTFSTYMHIYYGS